MFLRHRKWNSTEGKVLDTDNQLGSSGGARIGSTTSSCIVERLGHIEESEEFRSCSSAAPTVVGAAAVLPAGGLNLPYLFHSLSLLTKIR